MMRIIGVDGYNMIFSIDKEEYAKLVKAYANLDDDNTEEN